MIAIVETLLRSNLLKFRTYYLPVTDWGYAYHIDATWVFHGATDEGGCGTGDTSSMSLSGTLAS